MSRSPGISLRKPDRPGFRGALAAGLLALGLALSAGSAAAQGPDADWRTLSTGHFRVHYPVRSEAWARRAASRIESIWARVEEEVGYRPSTPVDVVVSDPVAEPNGSAWPFLGWPRIVLWTSPPGPDSVIGHYRDWSDLLVVHEATHLVHLLRPSRNPFGRRLGALLPLGPVARKSPRWVTEGYATVVEGRLTGFGRPNGDLRAALLRRLAQAGQLPSYGELNGNRRWLGGSMAYLVGSAYLEWLDTRAGGGSLPKLWARLSAYRSRSFPEAFEGVYGDRPERLYGEFVAETTHKAVEARRRTEDRAGELWQDLDWSTGAPALSPDGDRLAIVLTGREQPAELVVWGTGPDEKAEAEWEKQRREIAERDPEDVPAVRVKPLRRKPLFTLAKRDGRAPSMPRWMPDGRSLLYVQFEPDGGEVLHPDLFQWFPESGKVLRRTRFADLRDPDPAPDGSWAVAVRNRNGWAQLVRVVLETGKVTELTPPSVEETHDRPRVAPDGSRIAWVRHRAGAWNLVVRDLATGAETEIAPTKREEDRCTLASAAWSGDGRTIFAVKGCGGFIDVWAFAADSSKPPERITREPGASFAPTPTPDGQGLFYLALEADGLDLRRVALSEITAESSPEDLAALAPVVRPVPPVEVPGWSEAQLAAGSVYRPRQELLPLLGGSATSEGSVLELGMRSGDLIGQLDLLALGALGDPLHGGTLAATWRGSPLAYSLRLFSFREEIGFEQQGFELGTAWRKRYGSEQAELAAGVLYRRIEPLRGRESESGGVAFANAGWLSSRGRGKWSWEPGIAGHLEHGEGWNRWGGRLDFAFGHGDDRLKLSWRRDRLSEAAPESERIHLGGADSGLWPAAVRAGRIPVPALPAGWFAGSDYEGQRAELRTGALPVDLFWARHRTGDGADWLSLAGLERAWAFGPFPVARLPAVEARIGVAKILDEPFAEERLRGRIRGWLGLVWRP